MDAVGTLVIGAGVIGSAVAMHLADMGAEDVYVVDPDLAGARSSSERNAGGVRANWWQPVNVALSVATIDWLGAIAAEVAFRQHGYLWMYDETLWPGAQAHAGLQRALGREVELLSAHDVADRFRMIDRLGGVAGATLTPSDGLVNSNAVKEGLRARARAAGAHFVDRALVTGFEHSGRRVESVRLARLSNEGEAARALEGSGAPLGSEDVFPQTIVNASGPWSATVSGLLGSPGHSHPIRRQVSLVASRDVDLSGVGMIVDTSGAYLHHEGGDTFLAGYSPPGDPHGIDFTYDAYAFFEAELWPRLVGRMSAMDRLEYRGGWAGLYDMSEDGSAILGLVPGLENVYEAHSFSGRGVMQSWAAGRALAELMLTGGFRTIDASALSAERFALGRHLTEPLHI